MMTFFFVFIQDAMPAAARARAEAAVPLLPYRAAPKAAAASEEADADDASDEPALARLGTPEDVARMAVFLADPARSGYVTGASFRVDGGIQL